MRSWLATLLGGLPADALFLWPTQYKGESMKWRLADHDPGSDVAVTYGPVNENEPDIPVFSVHVWHGGTDQCRLFAEELCKHMNAAGIKPPEGLDCPK